MLRLRVCPLVRFYSVQLKSPPNQPVIDLLLKYKEEEESNAKPNAFKLIAYTKAINQIKQLDEPLRSAQDILNVPGIGTGIARRINEFLLSDSSSQEKEPTLYQQVLHTRAIAELSELPGIGSGTAKKLVEAGCLSVSSLQSGIYSSLLTTTQRSKLKYMNHLMTPVNRDEADDVLEFCRVHLRPECEVFLVGDYRRGSTSFPEIEIMISHPLFVYIPLPTDPNPQKQKEITDASIPSPSKSTQKPARRSKKKSPDDRPNLLQLEIIPLLQQLGIIAAQWSSTYKSWSGIVRIPGSQSKSVETDEFGWGSRPERIEGIEKMDGRFVRMRIHFVPQKSRGSSLLYFTGDDNFIKDIRFRTRQRDMLFNEYGLWKWTTNSSDSQSQVPSGSSLKVSLSAEERGGYWSLIKSETETEIFQGLGMDPIDPTRRNYSFVSGNKQSKQKI